MGDDSKLKLDGEGYSREPFSEDELAKHRHMHRHYQEHFLEVDKFLERTGLQGVVNLMKGGRALVAVLAAAAVIGTALAYMSERGFF